MHTYCPYDNDITNQLLNVLPCNMHVVHPRWECYIPTSGEQHRMLHGLTIDNCRRSQ